MGLIAQLGQKYGPKDDEEFFPFHEMIKTKKGRAYNPQISGFWTN